MPRNNAVTPFLKWVGGKRQLLPQIRELLPRDITQLNYCEPFLGGGALLFSLRPQRAVISDYNSELINVYTVVRDKPLELLADLTLHENTAEYYYAIRAMDRRPDYLTLSDVKRASRFIYLNKTCYNGLYRVNNAGEFNAPFGRYKAPNIVNEEVIMATSDFLRTHEIAIRSADYEEVLQAIPDQSFVYLDPPYHPISGSSSFTGYVRGGWGEVDQRRLRDVCDASDARGIKFLLSNSATELITELYANYDTHRVQATRAINSVATRRGVVDELLIRNYA